MIKCLSWLGGVPIACVASIALVSLAFGQSEEYANIEYDEIDTEAMLIEKAQLSPMQQDAYQCKCIKRYNDLGMRLPTRCSALCVGKISISNLSVERAGNVTFSLPNVNEIPSHRETRDVQIANCRAYDYSWNEKLVLEVVQSVESRATTILKDTRNWEVSLSLASISDYLNIQFGSKIGQSATVETSDAAVHSQRETFTIEKPLSVTVPPFTFSKVKYSDGRKRVSIPVEIELLLDGEVVEKHAVVNNVTEKELTGEIADPDHWSPLGVNKRLSKLVENVEQRTLTIDAEINVSGSDRNIEVALLERKLSPDSEMCRF